MVDCSVPNTWYGSQDCFVMMAGGIAAETIFYGKFDSRGSKQDLAVMRQLYALHGKHFNIKPINNHKYSVDFSKVFKSPMSTHEVSAFENAYLLAKDLITGNILQYNQLLNSLLRNKTVLNFK
jgi:hypothetical protein